MIRALFPEPIVTEVAAAADWIAPLLPEEAEQIRSAGDKRRREFTAGRSCARRALAALGFAEFALLSDAERVPRWPPGVVGSLSHSGRWCGVVVARTGAALGLGLDVEAADPLEPALAPRICTGDELARFRDLPELTGSDWPKLAFSAKEAVYKSYFPLARCPLGFHDVELEIDVRGQRFEAALIRHSAPAAAGRRRFPGRFGIADGYVYTGVHLT